MVEKGEPHIVKMTRGRTVVKANPPNTGVTDVEDKENLEKCEKLWKDAKSHYTRRGVGDRQKIGKDFVEKVFPVHHLTRSRDIVSQTTFALNRLLQYWDTPGETSATRAKLDGDNAMARLNSGDMIAIAEAQGDWFVTVIAHFRSLFKVMGRTAISGDNSNPATTADVNRLKVWLKEKQNNTKNSAAAPLAAFALNAMWLVVRIMDRLADKGETDGAHLQVADALRYLVLVMLLTRISRLGQEALETRLCDVYLRVQHPDVPGVVIAFPIALAGLAPELLAEATEYIEVTYKGKTAADGTHIKHLHHMLPRGATLLSLPHAIAFTTMVVMHYRGAVMFDHENNTGLHMYYGKKTKGGEIARYTDEDFQGGTSTACICKPTPTGETPKDCCLVDADSQVLQGYSPRYTGAVITVSAHLLNDTCKSHVRAWFGHVDGSETIERVYADATNRLLSGGRTVEVEEVSTEQAALLTKNLLQKMDDQHPEQLRKAPDLKLSDDAKKLLAAFEAILAAAGRPLKRGSPPGVTKVEAKGQYRTSQGSAAAAKDTIYESFKARVKENKTLFKSLPRLFLHEDHVRLNTHMLPRAWIPTYTDLRKRLNAHMGLEALGAPPAQPLRLYNILSLMYYRRPKDSDGPAPPFIVKEYYEHLTK